MEIAKVRRPAVAGTFYEGSAKELIEQVDECLPAIGKEERQPFLGAVVPHAGLMYSGAVAGAFYAQARLPRRLVILGPNHTGLGAAGAISGDDAWKTPFGDVRVDRQLGNALAIRTRLLRFDSEAHLREHSIEVQLPLLQRVLGKDFSILPVCLAIHQYELCQEVGQAIAAVMQEAGDTAILASSDLNHYEDQQKTTRKDQMAIDAILALDTRRLWDVVHSFDISMCGIIPTTTMLIALKVLGATKARLLRHATSGDVSGDYDRVVGYASIVIS